MGKICYIMGKSSSGKDTIFRRLTSHFSEFGQIVLYTTRPIRDGETNGVEYHFVDENRLKTLEEQGRIIEMRSYHTKYGVWTYATVDDGQIDLSKRSYFVIGTLESYERMCQYFGQDKMIPIYIEVEDGIRLSRALARENQQAVPKYTELCRRFLADAKDFSEEHLMQAGIHRRFVNHDMECCFDEIVHEIADNI